MRATAAVALALALGAVTARAEDPGADEPLLAPTGPFRVEARALLPSIDPEAPLSPESARDALRDVLALRPQVEDALVRERIDCYRRFLVNRCLADVRRRAFEATDRLDRIEIAANRRLREEAALELNRRVAEDLARRDAQASTEAARAEENRRSIEARREAAAAEAAARERDAAVLADRERANRAERERREAQAAARREDAERRVSQDASNAAARERAIAENRRQAEERARRAAAAAERRRAQAEERERRQAEADGRREEAARRRQRQGEGASSPVAVPPVSPGAR